MTDFLTYNHKSRTGKTGAVRGELRKSESPSVLKTLNEEDDKIRREFFFSARYAELKPNDFGKEEITLRSPSFSDCDRVPPHHDIAASTATFSSGEKVELWNIRPRMFRVPYFYFPYAVKDLQYDWPWTHWEFGSKADWGPFASFKTLAFPKWTEERSKIGFEFREKRGFAYNLDWKKINSKINSRLSGSLFDEEWMSNSDLGSPIHQRRTRLDLYHRQKISEKWQVTAEGHYFTPTKKYFWRRGRQSEITIDQHASPFGRGNGIQERKRLFQEYFEEEFRRGRKLENSLALDYYSSNSFITLSTLQPIDEEETISLKKNVELSGRTFPESILGSEFFYSNIFSAGHIGRHIGLELTDADRRFLFQRPDVFDFMYTRLYLEHKIERAFPLSHFLVVTPYIGERTITYENILIKEKASRNFWAIDKDRDTKDWFSEHRLTAGTVFSSVVTGYFKLKSREFRHQIRPSVSFDYFSPSGFRKNLIPVQVDELDTNVDNRLKTVYRIDNHIDMRDGKGNRRKIYTSSIQYRFLDKHEDNILNHDLDLRRGTNLEFNQSIYPLEHLRFSTELLVNTFHGQASMVRNAIFYEKKKMEYGWNQVYEKELRNGDNPRRRHDFTVRHPGEVYDVELNASWEEALDVEMPTSFARQGFRRLELLVGRRFHKMRGQVEIAYDLESSGATLIFRFGPEIFGKSNPNYRYPL